MKTISFPFGREHLEYAFDEKELQAVLTSSIEEYVPELTGRELVKQAMENPVGSPKLSELAVGKKNVVIIASDHTRPVPSKVIMPEMLEQIRKGSPNAKITILIATGCHRGTTRQELVDKLGEEIVEKENIYIHDCADESMIVDIGVLPSGGRCRINKLAWEADLLVAEGFIEPHFFAGFSGGRKSVLPGIAARETVLANHCSEFIADARSRTGILEGNPVHADMIYAAQTAKLCYIVNVVLNSEKQPIYAVAGDLLQAHKKGTDFISSLCGVKAKPADIVISTNGGYPLDQYVYQAVKGMTAAEAAVKEGGVIIMLAASDDGTGGDHFYHQLADEPDIRKTMAEFLARKRNETLPDQWQSQIIIRILMRASVIYISNMPDDMVEGMHMIPAHSLGDALAIAKEIVAKENPSIIAIPDGISVIVNSDKR